MRLRQRPARASAGDWLQPSAPRTWTAIGNLDSVWRGQVDPAGFVTIAGARWSLDWWIGAEDRWHIPGREVAVRQSLLGGSPVVETRLRVPGGDAVQRAYAARSPRGQEALVVEVENQSKLPFAVAFALRPYDQSGPGRIDSLALHGTEVVVDGAPAVLLPKAPGRVALSDAARGDCASLVLAGEATLVSAGMRVSCRDGLANAALLFPLAHTASIRVGLPLGASAGLETSALPTASQVASGWSSHTAGGVRIELPDRRLRDAVIASTRHLLLGSADPEVAAALDVMGFPDEAARRLMADPVSLGRCALPGAALHALARHWVLTRDADFARASIEIVAVLVARVANGTGSDAQLGRGAFPDAADLLDVAGESRAARDLSKLSAAASVEPVAPGDLGSLLSRANSTWTFATSDGTDALAGNAQLVRLALDQLVVEQPQSLLLCPEVPPTWLGQGWELHRAPTRHGRLSYAVRWHGDRPALLWELEPHASCLAVTLTAPGLDPAWSTDQLAGEVLLAAVAIPERTSRRGLTIPVSIETSQRGRQ
ncbi:MAG: hypothetical protein ACOYXM_12550 [Actinomycetota bacterium]